jgi:branched-chain amino acid transport system ATP-binding protein
LSVSFGALRALDAFSFDFASGGFYGLIGPNGAGKTTLINVLSGRQPASGTIRLGEHDISSSKAYERARRGIGRSFQVTKVFPEMTVLENLKVAARLCVFRLQPFWPSPSHDRRVQARVQQALETAGLERHRNAIAGALSYGLQRALELSLTLIPEPRILLLDEPLAGVGHNEIEATSRLIANAGVGRTVLLVEHNMQAVMELSDTVLAMASGALIASGPPESIKRNETVRRLYLGEGGAS